MSITLKNRRLGAKREIRFTFIEHSHLLRVHGSAFLREVVAFNCAFSFRRFENKQTNSTDVMSKGGIKPALYWVVILMFLFSISSGTSSSLDANDCRTETVDEASQFGVGTLDNEKMLKKDTEVWAAAVSRNYKKPPRSLNRPNSDFVVDERAKSTQFEIMASKPKKNPAFRQEENSMISIRGNIMDLSSLSLSNILLATDIEGGLHGIDRKTGELLWSLNHDNFSPLIEVILPSNLINETLIVEPFGEGEIYYLNIYQGLQKLPVSVKQLVEASPLNIKSKVVVDDFGTTIEDEKIYTGSRKTAIYTINARTGDIISAFGPGTENRIFDYTRGDCAESMGAGDCEDAFVIGKTVYELTIHSNDQTLYHVKYSQWQHNTLVNHLAIQNADSRDGIYISSFRDKSLLAADSALNLAKWVCPNLPAIVNNVFEIFIDYSTHEKVVIPHPSKPLGEFANIEHMVYLDTTETGTWFAFSSENFPSLVNAAPLSKFSFDSSWRRPEILKNQNLMKIAISGVHQLSPQEQQMIYINDEPYESLPALPPSASEVSYIAPLPQSSMKDANSKELEQYISPREIYEYKLKLQQVYQDSLKEKGISMRSRVSHFFIRVLESGFMLVFTLLVFYFLGRFKILPPMNVLLQPLHEKDIIPKNRENGLIVGQGVDSIELHGSVRGISKDQIFEGLDDKKKRKRGSRGGKKNKKKLVTSNSDESNLVDIKEFENEESLKHLTVSDKILGYGSAGTVILQGSFQNRPVAVKRLLIDFYDIASREIQLLSESDDHPNVIRYYFSESTEKFLYIAVELCLASLEKLIENSEESQKLASIRKNIDPMNVLVQITSGVQHLHSMKIVHRDLKPQNILIAPPKNVRKDCNMNFDKSFRVLISDFGLCKKLEYDESSFRTSNFNNPIGTSGWRAPEVISGKLDLSDTMLGDSSTSTGVTDISTEKAEAEVNQRTLRLTSAVDIFSLGCIFYYVLSNGQHPFGDRLSRDANIVKGEFHLPDIEKSIKERSTRIEATNLITTMLDRNPLVRPSCEEVLKHPFFWSISKKLEFLLKVSDRFEVERRDPPSPLLLKLEAVSLKVIPNGDWTTKFDSDFMDNLGKYRKYKGEKLMDLLRALRNKYHHFRDLPEELSEVMSPIPDGFYTFFLRRFPNFLMEIYFITKDNLSDDQVLSEFF